MSEIMKLSVDVACVLALALMWVSAFGIPIAKLYHFRKEPDLSVMGQQVFSKGASIKVARMAINVRANYLERWLPFLGTTAYMSPFIGLVGTVLHIIVALSLLSNSSLDIRIIANPISQALWYTLAGIVPAIVAGISYNLLTHRVTRMREVALESLETLADPAD